VIALTLGVGVGASFVFPAPPEAADGAEAN